MKRIFLAFALFAGISANAQTAITQAVITAKTSMTMPDDFEMPAGGGEGGGDRVMMINGMAGGGDDNKTITYYKNDKVKIVSETGFGRNTTIIDKSTKTTTTLIEAMGTKRGFFSTEADEADRKKRMDSLMGVDPKKYAAPVTLVEELPGAKKIAGYDCKQALIKTTRNNGRTDSVYVWYAPELKMGEGFSFGSGMGTATGLDKLNGFPMEYEMKMRRGIKLNVQVTKVDTKKAIDDKEFEVPKDFVIKPMKDMQMTGDGGQRFEMRIQR
jgi:hypothetical protein